MPNHRLAGDSEWHSTAQLAKRGRVWRILNLIDFRTFFVSEFHGTKFRRNFMKRIAAVTLSLTVDGCGRGLCC
jgi:hypothetical protein